MERELEIKTEYLKLIVDIGYDYDGMATRDGLQGVINDLIDLARKALAVDDKTPLYIGDKKLYNVLMEEVQYKEEQGDE